MNKIETDAPVIAEASEETDADLLRRPTRLTLLRGAPIRTGQGVVIGTLTGFDASGEILVDFPGNPSTQSLTAPSAVAVKRKDVGREVVLQFLDADIGKPVVLGLLLPPDPTQSEAKSPLLEAEIDGQKITLTAQDEIVLRCGKASITLTRAGKVLIKGAYLLNRSTGVNRIKGGSVQIN